MNPPTEIVFYAGAVIASLWFSRNAWKDSGQSRWQRTGLSAMLSVMVVMGALHIGHALHAGWASPVLLSRADLLLTAVCWCSVIAFWSRRRSPAVRLLIGLFAVGMIGNSLFEEAARSGLAWHSPAWLGMISGGAVLLGIWYLWYEQIAKTPE